ncbi:hypothetical protein JL101_035855 (plasmid) [Skermanella rosea]|uniref:hypothetical protein n=1 Tax=Skermanella rosea TaxID=1817965 RepID=UPI00193389EE|nr:hypothetical protein [Skermanella rosea]UEM08028.1 hypothetical protein JL101_035855 [Skermanella rosea]
MKPTVLVIENEMPPRLFIAATFRRAGFAVVETQSEAEALEHLALHAHPVALLVISWEGSRAAAEAVLSHSPGAKVLWTSMESARQIDRQPGEGYHRMPPVARDLWRDAAALGCPPPIHGPRSAAELHAKIEATEGRSAANAVIDRLAVLRNLGELYPGSDEVGRLLATFEAEHGAVD